MNKRHLGSATILVTCLICLFIGRSEIPARGASEAEPIWLQNIHKVLPDWDPEKDTPIPDWAKPEWAVSPHGTPTEVSVRGPYSDNVEWLNASDVFTPKRDFSGAVYR